MEAGAIAIQTHYDIECVRNGDTVWREEFDNLVPIQGRDIVLLATFVGPWVESPGWKVGLIDGTDFDPDTAFSEDDILDDDDGGHPGWTSFTDYDGNHRVTYSPAAPSNGEITNADDRAVFDITDDGVVAGAYICDQNAHDAEGTLASEGAFVGGPRTVENGDQIRVTAAIRISVP